MKKLFVLALLLFVTACSSVTAPQPTTVSYGTWTNSHIWNGMSINVTGSKATISYEGKSWIGTAFFPYSDSEAFIYWHEDSAKWDADITFSFNADSTVSAYVYDRGSYPNDPNVAYWYGTFFLDK